MIFKAITAICFIILSAFLLKSHQPKRPKIIMAVFAHADDEIDITPLLSKLSREGHTVYFVLATRGEKGVRKHAGIPAGDSLAEVRRKEAICASSFLNIAPPVFLEMNDVTLNDFSIAKSLHNKIDSLFRKYQPDIVLTWGPEGGYGHPDHRMVHNVVTEVFQSGQQAKPSSLFYTGIPTEHWESIPAYITQNAVRDHHNWMPVKKVYLTTRIKCDKTDIEKALMAMYCYRSQFTKEELDDNKLWMLQMNKDTVYLRSFIPQQKISYKLF